jgi:hypothetical protein
MSLGKKSYAKKGMVENTGEICTFYTVVVASGFQFADDGSLVKWQRDASLIYPRSWGKHPWLQAWAIRAPASNTSLTPAEQGIDPNCNGSRCDRFNRRNVIRLGIQL